MMRLRLRSAAAGLAGAVILLAAGLAVAPTAVAQQTSPLPAEEPPAPSPEEAVAAAIEGPWFGHIEGLERTDRYLEVMGVEPGLRGSFVARSLFGWADGPISPTPADILVEGQAVSFTLTASTGARVVLRFDGDQAGGTYQPRGSRPHQVQFSRLQDRPDYDWLGGVWIARRNGQTRVFDVKRVVATASGAILAIGQYGIAEERGRIRQMVATVDGDPATARIRWRTGNTTAELRRQPAASALTGSFEVRDHGGRAEPIIFMQSRAAPSAAPRQTIELGHPFPDAVLVTLDGDKVRASAYRGKTVIVAFIQSWDVWSTDQMRAFRAAAKRYGDRLAVLTVNDRRLTGTSPLANNVNRVSVDGPEIADMLDTKRIPTMWVLDRRGVVVQRESYLPTHSLMTLLDKSGM
jgi:AhpC/TSA family